ncbi:helix-turn-helix transcriptional regulator [Hymenobacter antarcticus]|uniref:HTH cro/C1-type domain-containing protein n=1 Tax=Hymenobacter antarcticus TaxID=486270 RepID=A0ABP7Q070_9BACT
MVASASVPIDQRFAQLIKQFGLTKNSFAISLGKTASVVQHLIDGRNKPGYDLLCKVFEIYPNVSRDWLLLGRGPMLVSGEPAPRAVAPVPAAAAEPPLEPIDLSDVEVPVPRRAVTGVAGSRLQPAEITATLALAAAANQPVRAAAPVPVEVPQVAPVPEVLATPPAPTQPATPPAPTQPLPLPEVAPAASAAPAAPAPAAPAPAAPAGFSPELYVTAALHAQHLQHQLALAEMRNQHLVEQQQMLREMLAMARQAMV